MEITAFIMLIRMFEVDLKLICIPTLKEVGKISQNHGLKKYCPHCNKSCYKFVLIATPGKISNCPTLKSQNTGLRS